MPRRRTILVSIVALALGCVLGGCITRSVREKVYEDGQTRILLRRDVKGSETIDKGYSHPLAIAPVRLAHILSRIDVRNDSGDNPTREPAFPTDSLYVLADHLSLALSKADPSQEIVVYYIRQEKHLKVFDRDYLYSFVLYAKGDALLIHLSHLGWEIPRQNAARNDRLPEPRIGDHPMRFRAIGGTGMSIVDPQSLAILWRDDVFQRPTRTRIGRDGQVVRRTILMESEVEEAPAEPEDDTGDAPAALPETLSAATLRALADIVDERARGEVTEAEYNVRRLEIIRADPAAQSGAGD